MKPQKNNQDSASSSRMGQTYKLKIKDNKVSDKTSVDITKYLITHKDLSQQSKHKTMVCSESPYKDLLTEVTDTNLNVSNEDDFAMPKRINKIQVNVCKQTKKHVKRNKQTILTKTLKEQSKTMKVNPDHLQLAIALSRSLQDNEKVVGECSSTQQKTGTIKENLQKFGFKCESNKLKVQNRKISSENYKRKFKYITPILFLRTQTDREKIVADKIALISQNVVSQKDFHTSPTISNKPMSKYLQENWDCSSKIATIDRSLMENNQMFYVPCLNINRCTIKCGSLLKDWSSIPGRELSPENIKKNQFEQLPRSPELFNSDDEILLQKSFVGAQELMSNSVSPICTPVSEESSDSNSLLNLTSKKKKVLLKTNSSDKIKSVNWYKLPDLSDDEVIENDNGICIFESFAKENNHMSDSFINTSHSIKRDSNEFDNKDKAMNFSKLGNKTELFSAEVKIKEQDFNVALNVTDYIYKMLDENKQNSTFILPTDSKFENLVDQNEMAVNKSTLSTNSSTSFADENKKEFVSKIDRHSSFNSTTSDDVNLSQTSQESIIISDEELNYSSIYSTPLNQKLSKKNHSLQTNVSTTNDELGKNESQENLTNHDTTLSHSTVTELPEGGLASILNNNSKNSIALQNAEVTPKNDIIVKTSNVTPTTNYDDMRTPEVTEELDKFGIKPLKRRRGIQMLKYIYESTHPVVHERNDVAEESDDEICRKVKKKKICLQTEEISVVPNIESKIGENSKKQFQDIKIVGDVVNEGISKDFIFERKQNNKIASCRLPLHIAWHNLVSAQPDLHKNILLYEPLQLEVLYQNLKESGYRYHIQDLLTFLDKKCVTVRTNNSLKSQHRKKLSRKKI